MEHPARRPSWRRANTAHDSTLNTELARLALEKVGNPNILVNLLSRRVRQLNSGGGGISRPLIEGATHLGAGDVALREIVEDKVSFESLPTMAEPPAAPKKRRRH